MRLSIYGNLAFIILGIVCAVLKMVFSTVGGSTSAIEEYRYYIGGCSVVCTLMGYHPY